MVAASNHEIKSTNGKIRRRGVRRHAYDAVEGWLHRAGGYTEGLDEKRLHPSGNDDGYQKDFDILAEGGVFLRRKGFSNDLVELGDRL